MTERPDNVHRLIDKLPAGIDDPWQAGWKARADQCDIDLADCAALNYERGWADAARKLPTFTTCAVVLTLAGTVGFLVGVLVAG